MTTATVGRAATARTSTPKKTSPPRTSSRRQANARAAAPKKSATARTTSQQLANTEIVEKAGPRRPVEHALVAAERAAWCNGLHLRLPVVGELHLPATQDVVFIGGIAALAIVGLIEWPVAVLLGIGHGLAASGRNRVVQAFGKALEEA